jgi:hypothetical protein
MSACARCGYACILRYLDAVARWKTRHCFWIMIWMYYTATSKSWPGLYTRKKKCHSSDYNSLVIYLGMGSWMQPPKHPLHRNNDATELTWQADFQCPRRQRALLTCIAL